MRLPAESDTHEDPRHGSRDDSLHASARHMAQLAPPTSPGQAPAPLSPALPVGEPMGAGAQAALATEGPARASLEDLLPALVRKVAWSGDGRRGALRLELGSGALSGGALLVQADAGQVRVRLTTPAGADVEGWRARISARLVARGLDVDSVEVE